MNRAIEDDAPLAFYTQKVFRSILDSMARPGKINSLQPFPLPCAVRGKTSAASILGIICTLLDIEVSFWIVAPGLKGLIGDIEFYTNARLVSLTEADYIVMSARDDPRILLEAKRGSLNYPDDSATIILEVDGISDVPFQGGATALSLMLEGPGILQRKAFFVDGITESFIRTLETINAEFPLGLDLILVSRHRIACIPRSTTIKLKDES